MTEKTKDVICGDGMCPYIPCKDYPNCKHIKEIKEKGETKINPKLLGVAKVQ